mgnify:FL=1|tara:strand:- start:622 stop:1206 length:585 start_codon:yes stop_codon:yes gene_type:complete
MKVLLVFATEKELIKKMFEKQDILITGVGTINTVYELTKKIDSNNYDFIINAGIAGSYSDSIKIGEVLEVVSDLFSEFGVRNGKSFEFFSEPNMDIDLEFKNKKRTKLKSVNSLTVNTINVNLDYLNDIFKEKDIEIESMEGAAFMYVCEKMNIPYIQIRSISNKAGDRNKKNWNLALAVKNLNIELKKIVNNL